jgi:hypothetical protein
MSQHNFQARFVKIEQSVKDMFERTVEQPMLGPFGLQQPRASWA